jgi:hypothetical protein
LNLELNLFAGANLISFPALPGDVSVASIFSNTGCDVSVVITASFAALNQDGNWSGSLMEVSQNAGYWVIVDGDCTITLDDSDPVNYDADGEVSYDMQYGNNLISYPFESSQSIGDALGDAAGNVWAIAGEAVAALNTGGGWVGSLEAFEGGKGYWLIASSDFEFSFNGTADGLSRTIARQPELRPVPEVYSFAQSIGQAFYFVANATIQGEALDTDDIIVAYNGDVVVGSRYWSGEFTVIHTHGRDISKLTTPVP